MRRVYPVQRLLPRLHRIFILGCTCGIISALLFLSSCSRLEEGSQRQNPVDTHFHDAGWIIPSASGFHGKSIATQNFSMKECQSCHGTDYKGGVTNASCFTCHQQGPETCNTCHGSSTSIAPPKDLAGNTQISAQGVGAHQKHLKAAIQSGGYHCAICHQPPASFADPVHITTNAPGAPVVFSDSLAYTTSGNYEEVHSPHPAYDRISASCSDTYCHGSFEGGNENNVVIWTADDQAKCGSCHGNPTTGNPTPSVDHPQGTLIQNCQGCHFIQDSTRQRLPVAERLSDGTYRIDIPAVHVDGKLNLVGGEIHIGEKRSGR
jgi:predicted CxxxxCH...CXXCH cytochrome family protein